MKSSFFLISVSIIWIFATTSYFIFPPTNIHISSKFNDKPGYWGIPDAEFNWCEDNYVHSYYIAEFWNTVTSFSYVLIGLILYGLYWKMMPKDLIILNFINICVGIGSMLFHGSLRYYMQLLDELPMFWLSFLSSISFYSRNKPLMHHNIKQLYYETKTNFVMIVFSVITTLCILISKKNHSLAFVVYFHYTSRNILVVGFLIGFLYICIAAVNCTYEIDNYYSKNQNNKNDNATIYYKYCLSLFGIAMMCWITDNFCCHVLQTLPFGIMYPHLHAIGWHLGTAIGTYMLFLIFICHQAVIFDKQNIQHKYFLGFFPYISKIEKNKKLQ